MKEIDEEIEHRNEIKKVDFKLKVEDMKHNKMLARKQENKQEQQQVERQKQEEEFMQQIL